MAPIEGLSGWSGRRSSRGRQVSTGPGSGAGWLKSLGTTMWVAWRAHVSDPTRERLAQLALHENVPLLGELGPDVLREGSEQVAGPRDVGVDVGEAVGGLPGSNGGVVEPLALGEVRRVEGQPEVLPHAFHVLDHAVPTADDPLLRGDPGEAQPGFEAAVVSVVERSAVAVPSGQEQSPGGEIEGGLTVVLLHERRGELPGEAQVQRQVARDPEVVLGEEADAVLELRPRIRPAAAALHGHRVEKKIREGEARERAGVEEVAEQARVPGLEARLPLVEPAPAQLHVVTARGDRQLLGCLEGLDVVELLVAGTAEAQGKEREHAQAGNGLATGDPDGRVRVADAGPVRGVVRGLHPGEAQHKLVQAVRGRGCESS